MAASAEKHEVLYLGIDGGGSNCRAVISGIDGRVIGRGRGGPANPFFGLQKSFDSIIEATQIALKESNLDDKTMSKMVAGIGLAGVNLPELFAQFQQWDSPFLRMYLTTDMEIANLGAHGGEEGAVIIVGTGSCGYCNVAGKQTMLGGHGFPIGDKASGAWMGLKAIEHTLLALDGFVESDQLAEKISAFFSATSGLQLSEHLIGRTSNSYAKLASIVFDSADAGVPKALEIIDEATAYIASLTDKLMAGEGKRLSMIGGLSQHLLARLSKELASQFSEAISQPEIGALHFAIKSWKAEQRPIG